MNPHDDRELIDAFKASEQALLIHCARIGCILVLILVLVGVSLDYFVYPWLLWMTIPVRVICGVAFVLVYLYLYTSSGQRYVLPLSVLAAMAPAIMICWMIYVSEGAMSPYYAGLNLVMIGICQLLPYTAWTTFGYCIAVLSCYLIACLLSPARHFELGILFNNTYFISLTAILCVTSCHIFTRRRFADFRLRYELDVKNRQLSELDRQKSHFFANVSHELRTPLTLILAPLESLLLEHEQLRPQHVTTLTMIRDNGLRLLHLIDDLLEIIRCEEGRVRLACRTVNLGEFLLGLIDSARELVRQRQLQLEVIAGDETTTVWADPRRLEKVILNLLTNAVKFTPAGGTITVRWWESDGKANIEVEDTGIGIAADQLPFVFDRFRQADGSLTRSATGLGLGLALAKEIVEEHDGTLTVTSRLDQGTSFRLSFATVEASQTGPPGSGGDAERLVPTDPAPPLVADPVPRSLQSALRAVRTASNLAIQDPVIALNGAGRPRVLIVDDEPDMRRFLATLLADQYQVRDAKDGPSGQSIAAAEPPDLMVVDHMMPGMTGVELCRLIRSSHALRHVKFLMLTARVDEKARIEALEAGVDDFLDQTLQFRRADDSYSKSAACIRSGKPLATSESAALRRLGTVEADRNAAGSKRENQRPGHTRRRTPA